MFSRVAIKNLTMFLKDSILSLLKHLVTLQGGEMDNNRSVGYYEDLIAELDLKLLELLSHIKLLANSTGTINDYKIEFNYLYNFDYDKDNLYDKKDIYEAQIYQNQSYKDIKRKIEKDNVRIIGLIGNKTIL